MFVVEIPFGVQESHEDPARENGLILITEIEGNNQGMWIYGLIKKKPIFTLLQYYIILVAWFVAELTSEMDEDFHDGNKENSMHSEIVENSLSMRIDGIYF